MAYQKFTISTLASVPDLVRSFAAGLGFTATAVSSTECTVKHPTYTPAKTFTCRLSNTGTGASARQRIELALNVTGSVVAWAESPRLNKTGGNTAADVTVENPTALHMFGQMVGDASNPGASFVAGVIEYGFNLYRHFYLGYVEKISAYGGGECITGSSMCPTSDAINSGGGTLWADSISYVYPYKVYPFQGTYYCNPSTLLSNGGVYIDHPDNPTPWRSFSSGNRVPNSISNTATLDDLFSVNGNANVLGGYGDAINTGHLAAAKSPYTGTNILVPVNLFIGKRVGAAQYFQPIGRAAGVRMVHMEDLEPGQEVAIGTSVWRVFPCFAKTSYRTLSWSTSSTTSTYRAPPGNLSQYYGLAYQVSA